MKFTIWTLSDWITLEESNLNSIQHGDLSMHDLCPQKRSKEEEKRIIAIWRPCTKILYETTCYDWWRDILGGEAIHSLDVYWCRYQQKEAMNANIPRCQTKRTQGFWSKKCWSHICIKVTDHFDHCTVSLTSLNFLV